MRDSAAGKNLDGYVRACFRILVGTLTEFTNILVCCFLQFDMGLNNIQLQGCAQTFELGGTSSDLIVYDKRCSTLSCKQD